MNPMEEAEMELGLEPGELAGTFPSIDRAYMFYVKACIVEGVDPMNFEEWEEYTQ